MIPGTALDTHGNRLPLFGPCALGIFSQKLFQTAGDESGAGEVVLFGISIGAPQQGGFTRDEDAPRSTADSGPTTLAAGLPVAKTCFLGQRQVLPVTARCARGSGRHNLSSCRTR